MIDDLNEIFKEMYKDYDFSKIFGPSLYQIYEHSLLLEYLKQGEFIIRGKNNDK